MTTYGALSPAVENTEVLVSSGWRIQVPPLIGCGLLRMYGFDIHDTDTTDSLCTLIGLKS
jgi:hypothetical protein